MKHRLHSAIGLVSWRLIAPIGEPAKPGVLPPNAPLSRWRELGIFDSSEHCEKALTSLRFSFEQDAEKEIAVWRKQRDDSNVDRALHAAASLAVAQRSLCIASNDQRVKKTPLARLLSSQPKNPKHLATHRRSGQVRKQNGRNSATLSAISRDPPDDGQIASVPAMPTTSSASPSATLPTSVQP